MHRDAVHHPVAVATDGTPAALRGVRYAAREAARLGATLEIVHVAPAYLPTGTLPMVPDGSLQAFGHEVLERSRDTARAEVGGLEIVTTLVSGTRITSLVELSSRARLLVLSAQSLSLADRVWTGATIAGVCARAACPVVVVPHDWTPVGEVGTRRIVVGFKAPDQAVDLLASAFAVASSRRAGLVVVHGWKLPSVYDDIVTSRVDTASWREHQTAMIEGEIAHLRRAHPDVKVSIEVVHGRPADALVQASRGADRLLISRPLHGGYFHHLGGVARAVLRESRCPVEVLPPVAVSTDDSAPSHGREAVMT